MTSQINTAIDKLYALFVAALGSDPELTVADGPQTTFPTRKWAVVGSDGPVEEEEDAARGSQEWQGVGGHIRDESIDVICAVGASTGDAGTAAARDMREEAHGLLELIEGALRVEPGRSLDGFVTGGPAAVKEAALRYTTNVQGIGATYVFTINIPVRSGP